MEVIKFVFKMEEVLENNKEAKSGISNSDYKLITEIANNHDRKNNISSKEKKELRRLYVELFPSMVEHDIRALRKDIWSTQAWAEEKNYRGVVVKLGNFYSSIEEYYSDPSVVKKIIIEGLLRSINPYPSEVGQGVISEFLKKKDWDNSFEDVDYRREKAEYLMEELDMSIPEFCEKYLTIGSMISIFSVSEIGAENLESFVESSETERV